MEKHTLIKFAPCSVDFSIDALKKRSSIVNALITACVIGSGASLLCCPAAFADDSVTTSAATSGATPTATSRATFGASQSAVENQGELSQPVPSQAMSVDPTSTAQPDAQQPDTQALRTEAILGYSPDAVGINFQVNSGGCTSKADFKVQVEKRNPRLAELKLLRMRPDTCRSFMPTGQKIYVTYSEMGINPAIPFTLANPNGIVSSWIWGTPGNGN